MDSRAINLEVITKQFRRKGQAAKGFKTINTLIKDNEVVSLRILLRDHKENPIDSVLEVEERDNIDFLIDYFSILEIGLIANYLPNPLPLKTKKEIEYLLSNEFLNKYFTKHYPLILPQLLLKQILKDNGEKYFYRSSLKNATALYDRFLMLIQIVKSDDDIDQFLWFLDDGWTNGYSISDFWNVLSDRNIIKYKLGSSNRHPLNSALWGFIKYIQFLSDFAKLLKDSKEDSLLQSAFWHHQSYWFDHMKEKIDDIINVGINNIRQSMNSITSEELINESKSFLRSNDDVAKWRNDTSQLEGVESNVKFLLYSDFDKPVKLFFNEV
jgi:hypothetical protein